MVGSALAAPAPDSYAESYGYGYNPLAVNAPLVNPSSQFHAQDELGQYNYGYSGPTSAKQEVRSSDGVVKGSYSYVDANGIIQTVNYISDAFGYRVAGTNIPGAPVVAPKVASYAYLPYAFSHPYYNYNFQQIKSQ